MGLRGDILIGVKEKLKTGCAATDSRGALREGGSYEWRMMIQSLLLSAQAQKKPVMLHMDAMNCNENGAHFDGVKILEE
ncbi:hypothetical protein [Endozoicomonas sp. Mp262]|uniref:hypothetical protein n=1 Tax=Endozoicomonas sp. Mp262 TaxID=2919499 RepID=UPI0021D9DA56